jgi:plastocyanin
MIDRVTTNHYIFLAGLVLVFLDRIRLLFFVMDPAQVLPGLAEFDVFTTGLVILLALNLLAIFGLLSRRIWPLFLGLAILVINLLTSAPFRLEDLTEPRLLGSWVWSLLILSGNLLGLFYGALAVGDAYGRNWFQNYRNRILISTLAFFSGVLLLGIFLSFTYPENQILAEVPDEVIWIDMLNMHFVPDHMELSSGLKTALYLVNKDDIPHSFDVDELGIHISVPPNSSTIALIQPTEIGEFYLYCDVPGHEAAGMIGTVTVRDVRSQVPR